MFAVNKKKLGMDFIVCCCDERDCRYSLLTKRNHVLATLCGIEKHRYVETAATKIQARVRGIILRGDKADFDRAYLLLINLARTFAAKRRFQKMKRASIVIQRVVRGHIVRQSIIGRLIKRYLQSKKI